MRRKQLIKWLKAHTVQLALVGISVTAIISAVLYREDIAALWASLQEKLIKEPAIFPTDLPSCDVPKVCEAVPHEIKVKWEYSSYSAPFTMIGHCRNLPEGQHPSAGKTVEALASGIVLPENQTYVSSYQKGIAA